MHSVDSNVTLQPLNRPKPIRLNHQLRQVGVAMLDGQWYSLSDLSILTGYPEASISARLRDFRKPEHGGNIIHREKFGDAYRYRAEFTPAIASQLRMG